MLWTGSGNKAQVYCLASADDVEIIRKPQKDAKKQIDNISKAARRMGLRIVYNKTKTHNTLRNLKLFRGYFEEYVIRK